MSLLKISLILSILGIFSLLLISEYSEIPVQNISDLTKDQFDSQVKISGKLVYLKETPGLYILSLQDTTGIIPVIIFKEDPLNLEKNSQLEITGKLTEYNKKLEITADKIKVQKII